MQSKSIEWFLYDVSFRHERDKYEFHHRYSTVNLIDAIQNKGQGMNLSTMQALRFDGLSFGLSGGGCIFPGAAIFVLGGGGGGGGVGGGGGGGGGGARLFNWDGSVVRFLGAGIWGWRNVSSADWGLGGGSCCWGGGIGCFGWGWGLGRVGWLMGGGG